MHHNQIRGWTLLSPALIFLLALGIFPLVYAIWLSFHSLNLLDPSRGTRAVGFENFSTILFKTPLIGISFPESLQITLIILVGSLCLELAIGLILAILVSRTSASVLLRMFRSSLMVPMLIAPAIVGMMFRFLFEPSFGLIDFVLGLVGVAPIYWISDPNVVLYAVILVGVWEWLPFSFLVFLAGIHAIPPEQFEAAAVDGAGFFEQIRYITLPWLRNLAGILILIRGVDLIRNFDVIFTLTYGGPGRSSASLGFSAYLTSFKFFEVGQGTAYAVLILILINILVLIFARYLVPAREETYGG
ncbi:MAG: sugar ABC transporter permease [Chloroflexi bacterium]|nr:sugar ABC transporter permease [Chloroflexota bacterium]